MMLGDHDNYAAGDPVAIAGRRRLAEEVRRLAAATVLTTADPDVVAAAAEMVREAANALDTSARRGRYDGVAGLAPGAESNAVLWETHAAFGSSNPIAPPVDVVEAPGRLEGTVTFGPAWEGGPGLVYGGSVASAFDGILGRTALSAGHLAVTKTLTVRFRRPAMLSTQMRVTSTIGEVADRTVGVAAQMWTGDVLTAEAAGEFVRVEPNHYRMATND